MSDVPAESLNKKVKEYQSEEVGQAWGNFAHLLPSSSLLNLAAILISSSESDGDQMGWTQTEMGCVSVKTQFRGGLE